MSVISEFINILLTGREALVGRILVMVMMVLDVNGPCDVSQGPEQTLLS